MCVYVCLRVFVSVLGRENECGGVVCLRVRECIRERDRKINLIKIMKEIDNAIKNTFILSFKHAFS